jgi:hypothetical protein
VNQQVQFQLVKGQRTTFVTSVSVTFVSKKEKVSVVDSLRLQELRVISPTFSKKTLQESTSPKKPTSPQRQLVCIENFEQTLTYFISFRNVILQLRKETPHSRKRLLNKTLLVT